MGFTKKSKWLTALFVSVVALTGCGKSSENASEVLDTARKQMNELSNYSMKMEMKMGVKAEGMSMEIPVVVDAKVDEKSGTAQMTTTASMFGMESTTEGYTQVVDGKTITYSKGNYELNGEQVWTKETSDEVSKYNEFVAITEFGTKIEKKKSNDKNADYYQVTISKEKMKELMNDSSSLMGDMDFENADIKNDVVLDIYVDKKSNYITKMTMDLKDVISLDDPEVEMEISECSFTFTFSDFNKVGTVTIPEDVITSAIDQSDDDWNYDDPEIIDPEM